MAGGRKSYNDDQREQYLAQAKKQVNPIGINREIAENRINDGDKDGYVYDMVNFMPVNKEGKNFVLVNYKGADKEFELTSGYLPLNICETQGVFFIFSFNPGTGDGEIGTFPSPNWPALITSTATVSMLNVYSPLKNFYIPPSTNRSEFRSSDFNFDLERSLRCFARLDYDGSNNIYFCDGENRNKVINSGFAISDDTTSARITNRLYTEYSFGSIMNMQLISNTISKLYIKNIFAGGLLKCGNYTFYMNYVSAGFDRSVVQCSSFVAQVMKGGSYLNWADHRFFDEGGDENEVSNKAVELLLWNLDESYKYVEISFVYNVGNTRQTYKIDNLYAITGRSMRIVVNGSEQLTDTSIDVLNNQLTGYNISEDICQFERRYWQANIKRKIPDIDILKRFALSITTNEVNQHGAWEFTDNRWDTLHLIGVTSALEIAQYKSPINTNLWVDYSPGDPYAFGIVYILNDHEIGPFPVTGGDNLTGTILSTNPYGAFRFSQFDHNEIFASSHPSGHYGIKVRGIHFEVDMNDSDMQYIVDNTTGFYFVRTDRMPNTVAWGLSLPVFSAASMQLPGLNDSMFPGCPYFLGGFDNVPYATRTNGGPGVGYLSIEDIQITSNTNIGYQDDFRSILCPDYTLGKLKGEIDGNVYNIVDWVKILGDRNAASYSGDVNTFLIDHFGRVAQIPILISNQQIYEIVRFNGSPYQKFIGAHLPISDTGSNHIRASIYSSYLGVRDISSSSVYAGQSDITKVVSIVNIDPLSLPMSTIESHFENLIGNVYYPISHKYSWKEFFNDATNSAIPDISVSPANNMIGAYPDGFPYAPDDLAGGYFAGGVIEPLKNGNNMIDTVVVGPKRLRRMQCWHGDTFNQRVYIKLVGELRGDDPVAPSTSPGPRSKKGGYTVGAVLPCYSNVGCRTNEKTVSIQGEISEYFPYMSPNDMRLFSHELYGNGEAMQQAYSKVLSNIQRLGYNDSSTEILHYPVRISFSPEHAPGSISDSYRIFVIDNYEDFDVEYGPIWRIGVLKDKLVSIQTRCSSIHSVNDKTPIVSEGGVLTMTSGDVLSTRIERFSSRYGSHIKDSVIFTGKAVYGVDWWNKKIWSFNTEKGGGFEIISDDSIDLYFREIVDITTVYRLMGKVHLTNRNVITGFDPKHDYVYFTFIYYFFDSETGISFEKYDTFVYNEKIKVWHRSTFYPNRYATRNDTMHAMYINRASPNISSGYRHDVGINYQSPAEQAIYPISGFNIRNTWPITQTQPQVPHDSYIEFVFQNSDSESLTWDFIRIHSSKVKPKKMEFMSEDQYRVLNEAEIDAMMDWKHSFMEMPVPLDQGSTVPDFSSSSFFGLYLRVKIYYGELSSNPGIFPPMYLKSVTAVLRKIYS